MKWSGSNGLCHLALSLLCLSLIHFLPNGLLVYFITKHGPRIGQSTYITFSNGHMTRGFELEVVWKQRVVSFGHHMPHFSSSDLAISLCAYIFNIFS